MLCLGFCITPNDKNKQVNIGLACLITEMWKQEDKIENSVTLKFLAFCVAAQKE